jgi:glutathione synthase/RimK-type ligase-like ATP-grasp enzyme
LLGIIRGPLARMAIFIVVDTPENWTLAIPGVEVVAPRAYLTQDRFCAVRGAAVFNLCRSYGYQRLGYYVSLLAGARGHKCTPSVETIQDMRSQVLTRATSQELETLVQRTLHTVRGKEFVLSIYFGQALAKRHVKLALALFTAFHAPLLRARFVRQGTTWTLQHVGPIDTGEVPEQHVPFLQQAADEYFRKRRFAPRRTRPARYDIAILHDPADSSPPSNAPAIKRFVQAAQALSCQADLLERDDLARVSEYDALLIRTTTAVNHFTYRFARRAQAEGLPVVDDPGSILRCTNKVFLAEMLTRHGIDAPKTMVIHRGNRDHVVATLGLPCVLKEPDSAFSKGVVKVHDEAELERQLDRILADSELVIGQEFVRTDFDWRIGVFDRQPLYACRYHMAQKHWQIVARQDGQTRYGKVDSIPVDVVPRAVLKAALRAANLIGDGLYGVDLKAVGKRALVIEVNDNPNIDAGFEDHCLGHELYRRIIGGLVARIERKSAALG